MSGRRMMTREVTKTTIKVAKMEIQEGRPVAIELPDEEVLGTIRIERAQRLMDKQYKGESVTVLQVIPETKTYEMEVAEFIKVATVKQDNEVVKEENQN